MIKLAFIGCGGFARRYHVPALHGVQDVQTTIICDPSKSPELARTAAGFGAQLTDRLDDLWAPEVCDAVIISTPHTMHADHTHSALRHAKHVMVDKPFVLRDSDAEKLSQLAEQRRLVNAVAFNRRFDAACRRAREIILQGLIGTVCHVETVQLGYEREGWFLVPELGGGGPFTGRASHMADLVPWLIGRRPRAVKGRIRPAEPGRSDHGGFIDMRLEDVDCRMTCIEAGFHMWDEIRIYGEDGLVELRRPLTLPIGWSLQWMKNRAGEVETLLADPAPGAATRDFLEAIRSGTAPACSFADARISVRIIDAAFQSALEGERWIEI
jgi:predicted dehydrogenase